MYMHNLQHRSLKQSQIFIMCSLSFIPNSYLFVRVFVSPQTRHIPVKEYGCCIIATYASNTLRTHAKSFLTKNKFM